MNFASVVFGFELICLLLNCFWNEKHKNLQIIRIATSSLFLAEAGTIYIAPHASEVIYFWLLLYFLTEGNLKLSTTLKSLYFIYFFLQRRNQAQHYKDPKLCRWFYSQYPSKRTLPFIHVLTFNLNKTVIQSVLKTGSPADDQNGMKRRYR